MFQDPVQSFGQPVEKWIGVEGNEIAIAPRFRARVLCFLGTECPVARLYAARLQELSGRWSDQVEWIGVFSNPHDSEEEIRRFARSLDIHFPLLKDWDQRLAREYRVKRTAEVVMIDADRAIRYRGRVDDQFEPGIKRSAPTVRNLEQALEQLLNDKPIEIAETAPVGCIISFQKPVDLNSEVTYCNRIAPFLNQHCVECHRAGEIGPFAMSEYEEVRGWADMMVEVMEQGRMPPWHANPEHGEFKNARHLPPESVDLLKKWIAAGTPFGDPSQLPPAPTYISGWRLPREPDLVVSMRDRAYQVPATGSVDYQYFVVDPKFTEDRWISAAQVVPGDASVVHHAIVFIRPPDGEEFNGIGWLTAFVPGQRATEFPSGYARKIPAGSKLVFQMHYTPNGVARQDRTKIGMNFIDANKVTHQVFTLVGIDQEFEIPPGAAEHRVEAKVPWLPKDGELLAVMPHMHLRGKTFQLNAVRDSRSQILLDVPRYDFNWQHTYELAERLPLNEIRSLDFAVTFDNSEQNPFNPNPKQFVMWGDQTWEEMAVAFFEVAKPLVSPTREASEGTIDSAKKVTSAETITSEEIEFADDFLKRFDRNRDQQVERSEVNRIVQDYSFDRLDLDHDRKITREELLRVAKDRRDK